MIIQQYARHNECPSNSRTFGDRRHLRLTQTFRITMEKFLQNFANPTPFLSEIAPQKARQLYLVPCAEYGAKRLAL